MRRLRAAFRSLAFRLVFGAVAWSLLILLIGGFLLSQQYRTSMLSALDSQLKVEIVTLAASAELTAEEGLVLRRAPADPRYGILQSGRYWALYSAEDPTRPLLQSDSLWDERLKWPSGWPAVLRKTRGETHLADIHGPYGQPARLAAMEITIPNAPAPLVLAALADPTSTLVDAQRFNTTMFAALGVMATGLVAMVLLQVNIGLAPLNRLRADVAEIRRGKRAKLEREYPSEVAPLTQELNALIEHNRDVVERARTHVGNLAHALKTPISVLLNEARGQQGGLAETVTRQAEAMSRNVDHYLQRAQAAARAGTLGARTEARPVLDDIARTLERLYGRSRDMDVSVSPGPVLFFRGERQDFEEMAGNLMENACKYGGGTVRATLRAAADHRMLLTIEDDGPGLAAEARETALKRGGRLDESVPGQGLGLSIVAELARLYGGDLKLEESELGGLSATLTLPAAD